MTYENPQQPEGVNYSSESPLKELFVLLAGAVAVVVALVLALSWSAEWLAHRIPFAMERDIAARYAGTLPASSADPARLAAERELQSMADRIARLQDLPPEMRLTVHLVDEDTVNAFATLGGHVVVMRGILARIPHENALVMLLGHEIAHVAHRDPVVALGRGVAVMTALAAIGGLADGGIMAGRLQGAGLLTVLHFNREQERAADLTGLATLRAWYGYTAGADSLLTLLADHHRGVAPPAFLGTHPADAERIAVMRDGMTEGPLRPLPAAVTAWLAGRGATTGDPTGRATPQEQ